PSIGTTVGVRVISQAIKILSLLRLRHLNFSITIPAFSHSPITAKEVHHDTLFSERTLQTFPGLIFFYCPGVVCHFLIF
ncbi:TPA: hypothetical protein ACIVZV_004544, partial [Salmonella enterica subsp. enterica serovar Wangata]